MDGHMSKEEGRALLMPVQGGASVLAQTLGDLEDEHDAHGAHLSALGRVMRGHRTPVDAGDPGRVLCNRAPALFDGLVAHMYLENAPLFPRFRRQ
jgi:iron-sulfur cluster repair protein YtfE (RIC family)